MMDIQFKQMTKSLHDGKIICFPTETLYALAVDAYNTEAIDDLYELKRRNQNKPFAIMSHSIESLTSLVSTNEEQLLLMKKYLPGPVTFILKRTLKCNLPAILGEKIAIRIPQHKKALTILKAYNGLLATTSTNFSHEKDSKKFSDIPKDILDKVSHCIECDDKETSGIGSTVIDITTKPLKVIRQGEKIII